MFKADPHLQTQSFESINFRFTRYLKGNSVQRQATLKIILENPKFYIKSIAFLNFMIQNSRRSLFLTDPERDILITHVNDYLTETLPPVDDQVELAEIEEVELNDEFGGDRYENPKTSAG